MGVQCFQKEASAHLRARGVQPSSRETRQVSRPEQVFRTGEGRGSNQVHPNLSNHTVLRGLGRDSLHAKVGIGSPGARRDGSEDPGMGSAARSQLGSTLPYRQATELLDCIRILGEESAAFCRQEVLGESPPPPPLPPPICQPRPLSRQDYLAEPGTSQADFGLTTLDLTRVTLPEVRTRRVRRGVQIEPTQAALPTIPSVFTRAGRFTEGTTVAVSQGDPADCPSGRYPLSWTITTDGAQKIREGEQEHCDDFHHAFDISLRPFANGVNQLAASRRVFSGQRHAERVVERRVGVAPADWFSVFRCLANKSRRRDNPLRLHTPRPITRFPRRRDGCAFARAFITATTLRGVGTLSSSQLISGCGLPGGAP